jgi:hypothetical protein
MTGLVRKAAVLAACGVLFGAAVAFAGVPSPGNSDTPNRINLGGWRLTTGLPDTLSPLTKVTVTVRDLANAPIANSSVVLDFTGDLSDTQLGDNQMYQGITTNCGTHGVSALTNGAGVATFTVQGGGKNPAGIKHLGGSGKIYADGVLLASLNVGLYDLNGNAGVEGLDLSALGADIFSGVNPDRANYNDDLAVDGLDLSIWGGVFFSNRSDEGPASYCP